MKFTIEDIKAHKNPSLDQRVYISANHTLYYRKLLKPIAVDSWEFIKELGFTRPEFETLCKAVGTIRTLTNFSQDAQFLIEEEIMVLRKLIGSPLMQAYAVVGQIDLEPVTYPEAVALAKITGKPIVKPKNGWGSL